MKRLYIILFFLIFLSSLQYSQVAQGDSTFTSLRKALNHPNKVKVLDLRGKNLISITDRIGTLKNLEILLLGSKLRNLKLYPPAWPYLSGKKNLPGGGYAHLQGRGVGKFYLANKKLTNLPEEVLFLLKLKVLDLRHTRIDAKLWQDKLKAINPYIIILSYDLPDWDKNLDQWNEASKLIKEYIND